MSGLRRFSRIVMAGGRGALRPLDRACLDAWRATLTPPAQAILDRQLAAVAIVQHQSTGKLVLLSAADSADDERQAAAVRFPLRQREVTVAIVHVTSSENQSQSQSQSQSPAPTQAQIQSQAQTPTQTHAQAQTEPQSPRPTPTQTQAQTQTHVQARTETQALSLRVRVVLYDGRLSTLEYDRRPGRASEQAATLAIAHISVETIEDPMIEDPMIETVPDGLLPLDDAEAPAKTDLSLDNLHGSIRAWAEDTHVTWIAPPRPPDDVARRIALFWAAIPDDYRQLLSQADGWKAHDHEVYGARAIRRIVLPDSTLVVLAEKTSTGVLGVREGSDRPQTYFIDNENHDCLEDAGESLRLAIARHFFP